VIIYTTIQSAGGGSFLSTNTDDDDISVFVQEIDAQKPLSGHQRIRSLEQETSEVGRRLGGSGSGTASRDEKPIAGLLSTDEQETSTSTGPMLTSESEVDERLRQMNQAFLECLEGLGGGRRREHRSLLHWVVWRRTICG
jgi:autophagy-related protein 13